MRVRKRELFSKYQADRGTQLAAMIAYYALLAFVPLMFLTVSLLGLFGRADESTYLVRELSRMFPESSVSTIVRTVNSIRANATVIGLIGLGLLLWSSLGLFGALESAFNIVYGRPNRSFFRGKALAAALMMGLLVLLFAGLVVGSFGQDQLSRHAPGVAGNGVAAFVLSVAATSTASFAFLFVSYYLLTNVPHTPRDVLPGALAATLVLALSFQVLPLYLELAKGSPALQAFGGPVILLVWLYLMANVIVLGAELNWWFRTPRNLTISGREMVSESRR
jgi:membrane protein